MANDLGAFIATEVTRSEQDYQNVRSRALSLVGVSGGLVALVSGLLAIAAGSTKVVLPISSRWTVGAALVAFVASTICALVINKPQDVTASEVPSLRQQVKSDWNDVGWDQQVASFLVDYLGSLRKDNEHTAKWLIVSIACQILGISLTAVTAVLILVHVN